MRYMNLSISPDSHYTKTFNAGVMYEHKAFEIIFHVDEAYINEDYKYYLEFVMPSGVARTDYLELNENDEVRYQLPNTVTSQMAALCYFNIVSVDGQGNTQQFIKAAEIQLSFSTAAGTDEGLCREYDFSVNALLQAIKNGTFKGERGPQGEQGPQGEKGDPGESGVTVDSELSASSTNPVENREICAALNNRLYVGGGNLFGPLNMRNNRILNLGMDSVPGCAANKEYVDSQDALSEKLDNKTEIIDSLADNTHYPSAKAVKDYVEDNRVEVDSALSPSSERPLQNKVINSALQTKLSLSGGTMSGNIMMGRNEIRGVKRIIFDETGSALWLNMSNCPVTHMTVPADNPSDSNDGSYAVNKDYVNAKFEKLSDRQTAIGADADDSHYPTSKAVKDYVDANCAGGGYEPVLLLSTTLEQETPQIVIDSFNSQPFYAKDITVQLDVPSTDAAHRIIVQAMRLNGTYQSVISQYNEAKTVTDASKHTLLQNRLTFHSNIWIDSETAAVQPANNVTWNDEYNKASVYAKTINAAPFDPKGTGALKIMLGDSANLPVGTVIKVWGEIKA